jgi:hypothetical protein
VDKSTPMMGLEAGVIVVTWKKLKILHIHTCIFFYIIPTNSRRIGKGQTRKGGTGW